MKQIINYKLNYRDETYDRKNNPQHLNIMELLPIGIEWATNYSNSKIIFTYCSCATYLRNHTGFGIVEFEKYSNKGEAYILNSDNSKRFDIVLPKEYRDGLFSDVYYVNDDLCFFFYCGRDYRAIVDENTGKIKDIIMSY